MDARGSNTRVNRTVVAAVVAAVLGLGVATVPAPVSAAPWKSGTVASDGACEGRLLQLHRQERSSRGLAPLREDPAFDHVARSWSLHLARTRTLAHNTRVGSEISAAVHNWRLIGENVAWAHSPDALMAAWMGSTAHRNTILSTSYQRVVIGCARSSDGRYWATANFVSATTSIPDRRPTPFQSAGDASARLRWWLLGRPATAADLNADAQRMLGSGWTAADQAAYLAGSSTHAILVPPTTRLYGAAFDRHPDGTGLVYWVRQRAGGRSITSIARAFVVSPEFRARYGTLGDAAFVTQVYLNVLGRQPDAGGHTYWVDRLRGGLSRAELLVGFSESPENKAATASDVTVSWVIALLLNRTPSAAERASWRTRVRGGLSPVGMVRAVVASDEFTWRVASGGY